MHPASKNRQINYKAPDKNLRLVLKISPHLHSQLITAKEICGLTDRNHAIKNVINYHLTDMVMEHLQAQTPILKAKDRHFFWELLCAEDYRSMLNQAILELMLAEIKAETSLNDGGPKA